MQQQQHCNLKELKYKPQPWHVLPVWLHQLLTQEKNGTWWKTIHTGKTKTQCISCCTRLTLNTRIERSHSLLCAIKCWVVQPSECNLVEWFNDENKISFFISVLKSHNLKLQKIIFGNSSFITKIQIITAHYGIHQCLHVNLYVPNVPYSMF